MVALRIGKVFRLGRVCGQNCEMTAPVAAILSWSSAFWGG